MESPEIMGRIFDMLATNFPPRKNGEKWREFRDLLQYLARFIRDHAGSLREAYLSIADGQLLCVLVRGNADYDDGLEEDITQLDIDAHMYFRSFAFTASTFHPRHARAHSSITHSS
jgi:hypothetical protein